jgi:hypothetical protein
MRPRTRDNLIYLAVGIGLVALLIADFFYTDRHGSQMWLPSRFAFRAVGYLVILGYFVARETRKINATAFQAAVCVLIASVLHLGVALAFRGVFAGRFGAGVYLVVVVETFLIVQLMVQSVRCVNARARSSRN